LWLNPLVSEKLGMLVEKTVIRELLGLEVVGLEAWAMFGPPS